MEQDIITKKTEWLLSLEPGQTKTGYFNSYEEIHTMSTLISRFNMTHGMKKGWRITSTRNWKEKSVTITCNYIEQDGNK